MECERAAKLISARLDGQIGADDELVLDAHLSACESCRLTLDDFQHQDAELRRAFAPRRLAAASIAGRVLLELTRQKKGRVALRWVGMLSSAAAGFAAALLIYHPHRQPVAPLPDAPAARLTLSTGAAEVMPPGGDTWHVLAAGTPVAGGSRLRTAPQVLCELLTTDGAVIRLNTDTELLLRANSGLELARGQVWTNVPAAVHGFQLDAPGATLSASGAEFDVRSEPNHTTVTVVTGAAIARAQGAEQIIHGGELLRVSGGVLGEKIPVDDLIVATHWLNGILLLKGSSDPEVSARVNNLMARVDQPWMPYHYEDEIRALGDHCVKPLRRYIDTVCAPSERDQRVRAMRILADIAQPWSSSELITLLGDRDQEVCRLATESLRRLFPSRRPRDECLTCCDDPHGWDLWVHEDMAHNPPR